MERHPCTPRWRALAAAALLPLALLSGCGGGGDDPAAGCGVAEQQAWLGDYLDEWYFWYRLAPRPAAAGFATVDDYFRARLYTGSDPAFPADRWSRSASTESFNRFFGAGRTVGYGVAVAGIEVENQPAQPLFVRYVEPGSPAAAQGVARGDRVLSINGRSAAEVITANDFSALTADAEGRVLTLVLRRNGADRTVSLTSANFALAPVQNAAVVTTPAGRRMGYVLVKDMIEQATAPLEQAFAQFRAAGVQEVVLDLRYNGGGLVSVANRVASHAAGSRAAGQTFATLLYNDRRAAINNSRFVFESLASSTSLSRVYVLAGPRTCSASEQLDNGLRGVGVEVVAIGGTTCGKPVGFLPAGNCGTTYSVVNFESVNARNEGRYFDGFAPTCAVAEDFTQPLGGGADPLLTEARLHADTGVCVTPQPVQAQALRRARIAPKPEAGERDAMIGR
jgi:hypothetical protein